MKKIFSAIAVSYLLTSTFALAGMCSIPEFIKEGAKIKYPAKMGTQRATVVKIDKESCWVKVDNGMWINLYAIPWIISAGK